MAIFANGGQKCCQTLAIIFT